MVTIRPLVPGPPEHLTVHDSETTRRAHLWESIAALRAAQNQWEDAYYLLRMAFELMYSDPRWAYHDPQQLYQELDRLRKAQAKAQEQSLRDSLTNSYNRRYLDQHLSGILTQQHNSTTAGFAIAIIDIDWFKQVNDRFSHAVGDRVLRDVVDLVQQDLPVDSFCARYGGEEFVLVLAKTSATAAIEICESARKRVADHDWESMATGLHVTISIGLVCEPSEATSVKIRPEEQLALADTLLYSAKRSGRNTVAYQHNGQVHFIGAVNDRKSA